MSVRDPNRLMHHEYDGIREYDNPLPGWWKLIFLLTIVFSAGYWIFYHMGGPGLSDQEAYNAEMEAHKALHKKAMAAGGVDENALKTAAADTAAMQKIKPVFDLKCGPCHGKKGEGIIGANLTDGFQIHGSTRMDIYKTIRDGVPAKGMIAWGNQLSPEDLLNVSAYVVTLRGKNVPGKKKEGKAVTAFK